MEWKALRNPPGWTSPAQNLLSGCFSPCEGRRLPTPPPPHRGPKQPPVWHKVGQRNTSGDNRAGWKATLGWLLEPDNFRKVQSGQYGSGAPAARQSDRMSMGTAGLGELERQAIARMLREQEQDGDGDGT